MGKILMFGKTNGLITLKLEIMLIIFLKISMTLESVILLTGIIGHATSN